jgi:hypothetical protein
MVATMQRTTKRMILVGDWDGLLLLLDPAMIVVTACLAAMM